MTIKDLSEKMDRLIRDVEELKKKPVNVNLVEEEEVVIQDVFFAEDKQKENLMILDLRAPGLVPEESMYRE